MRLHLNVLIVVVAEDKYDDSQKIATKNKHVTNKGIGLEHDWEYYATNEITTSGKDVKVHEVALNLA